MQIIVLALFSLFFSGIIAFNQSWISFQENRILSDKSIDSATRTFTELHNKALYSDTSVVMRAKLDKETAQKTIIRTCNAIYQLGIQNKCSTPRDNDTVWGFLKESGTKGDLVKPWSGATTSAFSCGSESDYGRYLLHNALPKGFVSRFGYDLNGLETGHFYPCAYSEIIYEK